MQNFRILPFIVLLAGIFVMMSHNQALVAQSQDSELEWMQFENAIEYAEENQKFIFVDVWAPWCGWCKKMQKEVYPLLSKQLNEEFITTRLNRDDTESRINFQNQSLSPLRVAQKLNVQSVPAMVILSPEGEYLFHISGFMKAEKLEQLLSYVVSEYQKKAVTENSL